MTKISDQEILVRFGSRLKRLRESKQKTLVDLASATGKEIGQIAQYEKGQCFINLTDLFILSTGLDVEAADFFKYDGK